MQSEMQHARQRRKAELAQEKEGQTSGRAMVRPACERPRETALALTLPLPCSPQALGRKMAGAVASRPARSDAETAYRVGARGSEADTLMSTHRTRQQELKARQDEDLDALHESVTRLHGVSTAIGGEIEAQGQCVAAAVPPGPGRR